MIYKTKINGNLYFFDGSKYILYKNEINDSNELDTDIHFIKPLPRRLEKLNLLVSTICNGQCIYCYQKEGFFGDISPIMDRNSADEILKYLSLKYDQIGNVSFFGGEPTLNLDILKYLTNELDANFIIDSFSITSNGTLFDKETVEFLSEFNYNIVLSIDGPEFINNKMRKNLNYDMILKAIELLSNADLKDNLILNCTYTKYHENNYDKEMLKNFFNKLGIAYHISDVITDKENIKLSSTNRTERNKTDISESFERLIDNSLNKDINNYARDIVEAILYGNASSSFCNDVIEGYSETFDTNSNRHHCISLIKEEIDFEKMNKINNKNNSICNKCWAKNLCRDCVTKYFLSADNKLKNLNDCNRKSYYEYSMDTLIRIYDSSEERFYKIFENYPIFI